MCLYSLTDSAVGLIFVYVSVISHSFTGRFWVLAVIAKSQNSKFNPNLYMLGQGIYFTFFILSKVK